MKFIQNCLHLVNVIQHNLLICHSIINFIDPLIPDNLCAHFTKSKNSVCDILGVVFSIFLTFAYTFTLTSMITLRSINKILQMY